MSPRKLPTFESLPFQKIDSLNLAAALPNTIGCVYLATGRGGKETERLARRHQANFKIDKDRGAIQQLLVLSPLANRAIAREAPHVAQAVVALDANADPVHAVLMTHC